MTDAANQYAVRSPGGEPRVKTTILLTFLGMGAVACLVAGSLMFARAHNESAAITQQAVTRAGAISFAFDQEVAAINYLLKGLSKSPALLSGDLPALHDQFKATPIPEDSWLIFNDLEKQLVNSLRPFGAPLPRHASFANYQEQIDRIRDRGWAVSGRMFAQVKGTVVVALSLRLNGADGQMTHWLTTILGDARLRSLLGEQHVPPAWTKGVYDRKLEPIVVARGAQVGSAIPPPAGLAAKIPDPSSHDTVEGLFEDIDENGIAVLVAYRHSGATNWTTVVAVPLSAVRAPLHASLLQISGLGIVLLLASGAAAILAARFMERPLKELSDQLVSSTRQVDELSGQLLVLQEEERQQIARELHDSTAQHLVAANLGLAMLMGEVIPTEAARKNAEEIESLLGKALRELRIFTYLLHPPDLARDGLQTTLREFIEGFAERTKLIPRIRIPEEVDALPVDIQWSILRVVQEALANVHRHASAKHVAVDARMSLGRLVVRIRDDGHGMARRGSDDRQVRFGVGIPGMRARLKQFGGDLRIKTGLRGTSVIAIVPLSLIGRASTRAEHLLEVLLARAPRVPKQAAS
ncbi:histidine kinase [Bosea sp. BH3]|uniref:histidine kinase n=1 Tax=Bosea sp. BH3 TaxID=2871701 RepID=UPI0021CB0ABE|nr:histidine kinase [Bosea sp. BH3]MCU4179856.1 hypothetical protein [Bosea sp. BH3]